MTFLLAKKLFKDRKYDAVISLAKMNNSELASVNLFLDSIISYTSDILYTEDEKKKAKELKSKIDKIEFEIPDEFKDWKYEILI